MDVAGHGQTLRDLLPIDGLDPREALRRGPSLVALQGPYQVPFDSRKPGKRGDLGPCLLNVIFSKSALSHRIRGLKRLNGEAFAHRQNPNRVRIAVGSLGGRDDAQANVLPRLLVWAHNRMTPA